MVKADIDEGKITLCDKKWLLDHKIHSLYSEYLTEKMLFLPGDQGEAAAIALARVTGAVSFLTDDTKIYGPHYTLIRRPDVQIIPLAYYEMIILACIVGKCTLSDCCINPVTDFCGKPQKTSLGSVMCGNQDGSLP